jgi:hypothetical protein
MQTMVVGCTFYFTEERLYTMSKKYCSAPIHHSVFRGLEEQGGREFFPRIAALENIVNTSKAVVDLYDKLSDNYKLVEAERDKLSVEYEVLKDSIIQDRVCNCNCNCGLEQQGPMVHSVHDWS